MNPDKPRRIWTLKKPSSGNIVTFKIVADDTVMVNTSTGQENGTYLIAAGRNMWNEYIRCGYRIQTNSKLNYAISKNKKLMSELNYALEA